MVNKRKRDDFSDSDSDEITPGKQTLPVANLPYDFDQEPQDGMQYLFLVRRDARRLPHVARVRNPYEVSETRAVPAFTPLSVNILPCEEWRITFQAHFSNLRKNLAQATIHDGYDHSRRTVIPEKKDRDAWWKFLTGCPESAWCPKNRIVYPRSVTTIPDVQPGNEPSPFSVTRLHDSPQCIIGILQSTDPTNSASLAADPLMLPEDVGERVEQLSPPEVTPSHLREIDHRMSIHLLMYFTYWINVHLQNPSDPLRTISVSHGQWMFALLTRVEDRLSADEMNLLRNLARACLGLIQRYKTKPAKNNATLGETSSPTLIENTMNMSDVSCWMIFAAIAGHWGQRDLWVDAETTLASV